jgi:hypothetical protein
MQRVTITSGLTMMVLVFLILCSIALPASAAQISIVPSSQTVFKGESFTVDIYVDPEGNATAGVDYILRFNNTLLNATSLTHGTFFDGFTTDDTYGEGINNTTGTVDYGELIWPVTGTGVTTPGTVTTITFQAIAEEDGVSELTFEKVTLSDPDGYKISTSVSNGNVSVFTGICGDATGDDKVTMADGRRIYMHIIYGTVLDCSPWEADVTGDDKVTMADGRRIYMNIIYGTPLNCKV